MEKYLIQILTNQMLLLSDLEDKQMLQGNKEDAWITSHAIAYSLELVREEVGQSE